MYINQSFKHVVLKNEQENTKAGVILGLITPTPPKKNKKTQQQTKKYKKNQELNGSLVTTRLSNGREFYILARFIFHF